MLCQGTLLRLSPRGAFGPLSSRLVCCGQAPEPRACEVDQGLTRLYRTTLMHPLGKEKGWGTPYYPGWASSNDLW
jgi:hypothetical protein